MNASELNEGFMSLKTQLIYMCKLSPSHQAKHAADPNSHIFDSDHRPVAPGCL